MPMARASAPWPPASLTALSTALLVMNRLKHRLIYRVKYSLLGVPLSLGDNQAMLETKRKAVALRLHAAMREAGVSNTALAEAAGVSVQAVTGWLQTGKIARERIPVVAAKVRCSVDWLLTGTEQMRVREPGATYKTGGYSRDEEALIETYRTLSRDDRSRLQKIASALAPARHAGSKRKPG